MPSPTLTRRFQPRTWRSRLRAWRDVADESAESALRVGYAVRSESGALPRPSAPLGARDRGPCHRKVAAAVEGVGVIGSQDAFAVEVLQRCCSGVSTASAIASCGLGCSGGVIPARAVRGGPQRGYVHGLRRRPAGPVPPPVLDARVPLRPVRAGHELPPRPRRSGPGSRVPHGARSWHCPRWSPQSAESARSAKPSARSCPSFTDGHCAPRPITLV
jgi:hypothetical protein